jgi:hypothetical protein
MVLNFIKKNKFQTIALMTLVISTSLYLILSSNNTSIQSWQDNKAQQSEDGGTQNISPNPLLVSTLQGQEKRLHQTVCEEAKKTYDNLDLLKKKNKLDLQFENTHKKVLTNIYRLRRFYKDGDEGEIETFLVYLENIEGNAKLIEKTPYKKGPLFLKIERYDGEIIYHEEGLNLNDDLFLHYINNQLMGLEGKNIDCRFQQV